MAKTNTSATSVMTAVNFRIEQVDRARELRDVNKTLSEWVLTGF